MSEFGPFTTPVVALHDALAAHDVQRHVQDMVTHLSRSACSWGTSPVESVNVLAGTLVAAATGMAGSVGSGGLDLYEVSDREDLAVAITAMRGAADVFEMILKAGRS